MKTADDPQASRSRPTTLHSITADQKQDQVPNEARQLTEVANADEPRNIVKPGQLPATEWSNLKGRHAVYRHGDLKIRRKELGRGKHLIEGLLPERAIGLIVGDSGLGKSPLLYQAALCIAAGVPFLSHEVHQGKVLFCDFENGIAQVSEMLDALLQHLGLGRAPDDLLLWNLNDSSPKWGQLGYRLEDMVREVKPKLVVLDSITAYHPDIEDTNSTATKVYKEFRGLIRDTGTSILGAHHLRKPSGDAAPACLETGNIVHWFRQTRGAGSLINASDVRLGVDVPTRSVGEGTAFAMRGFWRVRGEIPLTYVARVCDEDGEPLGYDRITGVHLLFNKEYEEAFAELPEEFRFKNAQTVLGKGASATTNFLLKCISCGILRKKNGGYAKVVE